MINIKNTFFVLATLFLTACGDDDDNSNQAPLIENQSFSIQEDAEIGELVGSVIASDPEGALIVYSIASGNEVGLFSINSQNGDLTIASSLDFETSAIHSLQVQVSDGQNTSSAVITVNVNDVVEQTSTIDGQSYDFKAGVIDDFGVDDLFGLGFSHRNYDFSIVNFQDLGTLPNEYALIYSELFAAGNSFEAGVFTFNNLLGDANLLNGEDFFVNASFSLVENNEIKEAYVAIGGSITVSGDDPSNYSISYELTLQEIEVINEDEIILTGQPFSFSFNFKDPDGFDYFDESGRMIQELNTQKAISKLKL